MYKRIKELRLPDICIMKQYIKKFIKHLYDILSNYEDDVTFIQRTLKENQ